VSSEAATIARLAKRIVEAECARARGGQELAGAVEQTFVRLESMMSTLIGPVGFQSIMARAVHLTRGTWPWIERTQLGASAAVVLQQLSQERSAGSTSRARLVLAGFTSALEQEGPENLKAGAAELLANVLRLFCTFIGEELTLRLMHRTWPNLAAGDAGPGTEGT
jgi:hypothetical protein